MSRKKKHFNPRVVVEDTKEGVRVRVDNAYSPEHVIFMLAQAQISVVLDQQKDKEVDANENVQELPTTHQEEPETH
jgi:hypothetical protein